MDCDNLEFWNKNSSEILIFFWKWYLIGFMFIFEYFFKIKCSFTLFESYMKKNKVISNLESVKGLKWTSFIFVWCHYLLQHEVLVSWLWFVIMEVKFWIYITPYFIILIVAYKFSLCWQVIWLRIRWVDSFNCAQPNWCFKPLSSWPC